MKNILLLFLFFSIFSFSQTKYTAYCIKQPHDGDTVKLLVNIGMDVYLEQDCRLLGIDTPEVNTKNLLEKEAGKKIQKIVSEFIYQKEFTIYIFEDLNEKFGRLLIEIEIDNICLNNYLVSNNLARFYFGDKKTEWTNEELQKIKLWKTY